MCPVINVHLNCGNFPQRLVNPRLLKVLGGSDCVVNSGLPLAPLQKFSFNYSHSKFLMHPTTWYFQCEWQASCWPPITIYIYFPSRRCPFTFYFLFSGMNYPLCSQDRQWICSVWLPRVEFSIVYKCTVFKHFLWSKYKKILRLETKHISIPRLGSRLDPVRRVSEYKRTWEHGAEAMCSYPRRSPDSVSRSEP